MKIAPVADVKSRFSAYLKASEEGPVVVTRNGKPVAVLLSMEDEDELERLILAYSPKFQSLLQKAKKEVQERGGIAHKDFWQDIENQHG
jgi:prevent-host-death family protein